MFRAKFAYETIVHANRFFMPIDFLLGCVDPWATAPALAMLHLARFQEFKVSSTLGQVLFETVDKFIPDGHAQMPFVAVNCTATERRRTPPRHSRRFLAAADLLGTQDRRPLRSKMWRPCMADTILKIRAALSNDDYEKLSASQAPAGTPSDFVGNPQSCFVKYVEVLLLTVARPVMVA